MPDYTYTKAVGTVNPDTLADEVFTALAKRIKKSVPADAVDGYLQFVNNGSADNLFIHFDAALAGAEETTLGTTVTNHAP